MKKIRTITFHSSYNYGSCLQAYALQEFIKKIENYECDYKIINLRTRIQRQMYRNYYEKKGLKNDLMKIVLLPNKKSILQKSINFEKFINKKLDLTREYSSMEEIKNDNLEADCFIAGSDQLWNLNARDFDWANYLEFVKKGKKISYAASYGPRPQTWNKEQKKRAKEDLNDFDKISVREKGSFDNVRELTGINASVNVDPTMLLSKEEWENIIPEDRVFNNGEYIFLYNLKDESYIKLAHKIARELQLPVVVSKYGSKFEILYGFKKRYECGPIEFLNLIKNAKIVLSSSFHGTIFSIILNKPFFALNGNKDFRINTLLKNMNLENRSIEFSNYKQKCKYAFNIDFAESKKLIEEEQKKSEKYLREALEI